MLPQKDNKAKKEEKKTSVFVYINNVLQELHKRLYTNQRSVNSTKFSLATLDIEVVSTAVMGDIYIGQHKN